MRIEMFKLRGGGLVPLNSREEEKMKRFKNGEQYPVDIVEPRNGDFHRKVFAFMNYCYEFWVDDNNYRSEQASFDACREHLTILAGYHTQSYNLDGEVTLRAKSWSYAKMTQDEFEQLYHALIQAAMNTIFQGCDESEYSRLVSFF